jgi:hypothetical protein
VDIEQALLEQVRSLTPEQQQEVLDFAAFLRQRTPVTTKERIPGLHKGFPYWIADDFDAPLPDEFWLGEP